MLAEAESSASLSARQDGVWVMGRAWYDRVRPAALTEEQEHEHADAHRFLWVSQGCDVSACPACGRPVDGWAGLQVHMGLFADPLYREPDAGDHLFGHPLRVVDGDVAPRLVSRETV